MYQGYSKEKENATGKHYLETPVGMESCKNLNEPNKRDYRQRVCVSLS